MTETAVILSTTVDDLSKAEKLADSIIKKKLAACVTIIPQVKSVYMWQDKQCKDEEIELTIKTVYTHTGALTKLIKRISGYDVPQIIVTPVLAMSDDYEKWYMEQINV